MRLSNLRSACKSLLAPSHAYQTALVVPLLLLCIAQAHGQLIVNPPTVSAPVIQSVPGTCTDYNATLMTRGVEMNGASNPGHCAKSQFTPLFNGQPIGTNWQQLMLGPDPPKFKETIAKEGPFKVCDTATDLAVDLSARVDVSELNWVPAQTIGPVCTQETNRANTAPMISAQNLLTDARFDIDEVRRSILRSPDTFTECAPSSYLARSAVQQKIWQVLNQIATEEQNLWHDPENALAARCAPECHFCNAGWVGTLTCTKTSRDTSTRTNYTWDETQKWVIGGVPQQQMGSTQYPATFTATGGGSKVEIGTIEWKVNLTTDLGTLDLTPVTGFKASQIPFTSNDITSTPVGYETTEVDFQFNFQPSSPTPTYTEGSKTPLPGHDGHTCHLPHMPTGTASCQVDCSWTLAFQ